MNLGCSLFGLRQSRKPTSPMTGVVWHHFGGGEYPQGRATSWSVWTKISFAETALVFHGCPVAGAASPASKAHSSAYSALAGVSVRVRGRPGPLHTCTQASERVCAESLRSTPASPLAGVLVLLMSGWCKPKALSPGLARYARLEVGRPLTARAPAEGEGHVRGQP